MTVAPVSVGPLSCIEPCVTVAPDRNSAFQMFRRCRRLPLACSRFWLCYFVGGRASGHEPLFMFFNL